MFVVLHIICPGNENVNKEKEIYNVERRGGIVYTVPRRQITIIGSFREEREAIMPDRLDYEILAKFRELTPEHQEVILAYLAAVLSEPAASSSDRR